MESTLRRTWAEIDLDALAHNYRRLRRHIGPDVRFLGVVKADAYGHGPSRTWGRIIWRCPALTRPWSCGLTASPCRC